MRLMSDSPWQEDAIYWLHERASELPSEPAEWHEGKPSVQACGRALQIVRRHVPAGFAPSELLVTPGGGIELDWQKDGKGLEIEILADGSIEVVKCVNGLRVTETLDEPDWRIGEAFAWFERSNTFDSRSV
jgi:hypothetical protein